MKKIFKKPISALLAFVFIFSSFAFGVANVDWADLAVKAEAATYNGSCGENLTWTLDESTGELVIGGTGAMTDWSSHKSVPWYNYRLSITIGNGLQTLIMLRSLIATKLPMFTI